MIPRNSGKLGRPALLIYKTIAKLTQTIQPTLPLGHGKKARIQSPESLFLCWEIFWKKIYKEVISNPPATFVDLGCNSGLFTLAVASPNSKGLAIDANPEMVEQTKKNIKINNLGKIHVLNGLAGAGPAGTQTPFSLNETSISSSLKTFNPESLSPEEKSKILVNNLNILQAWKSLFGEERIDLLKIDIEGSELDFLTQEPEILKVANHVLIECHKWVIDPNDVAKILQENGFTEKLIIQNDANAKTSLFSK